MSIKKFHQPLLFIQQPTFGKLEAPMQQSFLIKNRKNIAVDNEDSLSIEAKGKHELHDEKSNEIPLETSIANNTYELVVDPVSTAFLGDETEGPQVMEFILEGILSPGERAELTEEIPSEQSRYITYLESIKKTKDTAKELGSMENMVELVTDDKNVELSIPAEKKTVEEISKLNNPNENDIEINIFKKEKEDKGKSNKRIPFNKLSLNEKLTQLKITPPMKIKYRFITKDSVYLGYFLSWKKGLIEIDSITNNNIKRMEFSSEKLVDIILFGL